MDTERQALILAVELMTFPQLDTLMRGLKPDMSLPIYGAIAKRLYEIALFDNHVPSVQRKAALDWIDTLNWIVETSFKDNTGFLILHRKANEEFLNGARTIGIGTLPWLLLENNIASTDEMIGFISRPEYAGLLEGFYETLEPEIAQQIRNAVEQRHLNVGSMMG